MVWSIPEHDLREVYGTLVHCLAKGKMFGVWTLEARGLGIAEAGRLCHSTSCEKSNIEPTTILQSTNYLPAIDADSCCFSCQVPLSSCRIAARCPNNTVGTTTAGNRLNGKYMTAMFGCSNANLWNGDGKAKIAVITTFSNKRRQSMFQASKSLVFVVVRNAT